MTNKATDKTLTPPPHTEPVAFTRDQLDWLPWLDAHKATWHTPTPDLLDTLRLWWEPLLRRARTIRNGVGGNVRFRIGELDMVVDFPKAKVREYAGEDCIYWYTIPADLVSTNIADHEIDWSNSIFLSMQFEVGRSGKFNEFLTTFLKCLSRDRIEYVENWYAEQTDQTEDAQLGDWIVQRRCPHLRADLTKTGKIEDGVLTCSLHDWKWDLTSGKCLTSQGHPIRASQVEDDLYRAATSAA